MAKLRRFIDIGANLTDLMYSGVYNGSRKHEEDLGEVLKRGWDAGLYRIIITGTSLEQSKKALEIAQTDERLFATVGCHPTHCSEFESSPQYLQNLKSLIEHNPSKIVALGELGLDYDRTHFCPIETQKKYFELQLSLNRSLNLPLFLHCRNAASDLIEILSKYQNSGVVHSFDGTIDEAQRFLNMGFYIGLNGCSLKTKENLETVAQLPLDRILVETDCPWCEIRPSHAGFPLILQENLVNTVKKEKWKKGVMVKGRNEPCNTRQVLDVVAGARKEDVEVLSEAVFRNTLKLFWNE